MKKKTEQRCSEKRKMANPRWYYENGMASYYDGDYISAVLWNETCLREAPDWPYGFLAMHNIAATYHKAGLLKMADLWARKTYEMAPFFDAVRCFISTCSTKERIET